jgi:type II secretory pathway pseudopilin PulG
MRRALTKFTATVRGNSFVEVVVVVALVSVFAALVVPRYTSASEQAREEELHRELQIVRGQLEHFRQIEGCDPASVVRGEDWRDLLESRYLVRPPHNPLHEDGTTLSSGPTLAPGQSVPDAAAWYFDHDRRVIHAVDSRGQLLAW